MFVLRRFFLFRLVKGHEQQIVTNAAILIHRLWEPTYLYFCFSQRDALLLTED